MRLRVWRNWPLAAQLTLVMTALVTIAVISIIALYTDRERANFRGELEKQAETILVTLETTLANPLYNLDSGPLETSMEALGQAQTGVLGRIYDPKGRLIADSGVASALTFDLDADPFGQELVNQDTFIFRSTAEYLEAGKPVIVGNQTIGAISVQLSTQLLEARLQATSNQGIILALLAALIGSGLSLLVSRTVTRPLRSMTTAAERITAGDLTQRVSVDSSRELGALAATFNAMTDHLQTTIRQLEQQTRDLSTTNAELLVARDQATVASRLKDEFLSTMSHELRTPMNAIEGFISIMLSKMGGVEYNEKSERYLTRVHANSKRLLQLINDFLDLSRVESGRLDLAHQPFSPADLAQRWQNEIGVLAEKKNIGFELSLSPTLPEKIYGDEEAISKVALNLLSNAIKFTEQGKVSLSLQNGGNQWRIIVTDTGIGIPPHAREYVFEEFRQVDQTSRRKYGGTGLGLAIVQKYARTMGGTVTLQSEMGVGSTFTVTLPLQTQPDPTGVTS
jgi:two-component system, sensor histidine kinase